MSPETERVLRSVSLLVQEEWWVLVFVEILTVLLAFAVSVEEPGIDIAYPLVVTVPVILLGVPVLANNVALERSAGTLDLVLASPDGHRYFARRAAAFAVVLVLQSMAAIWFIRLAYGTFPLDSAVAHVIAVVAVTVAASLYWSLRVESAGGAAFATIVSLAALSPWLLDDPIASLPLRIAAADYGDLVDWLEPKVVLLVAAALFYAYEAQLARDPEKLVQR